MTLQQQWDIWLAASFAKFPSENILRSVHMFEYKMGMERDSLFAAGIKRVPKPEGQGRFSMVSRFVCGHIKGASEFMFDSDKNTIQKAALLARCGDSTIEAVDHAKVLSESREKARDKRRSQLAQSEYHLGNLQREAYARRNWGACK